MGTVRKNIIALLQKRELTALEISGEVGVPEKDVAEHLVYIRRSLCRQGMALHVSPARCLACGYRFQKRNRLTKPGRCPRCRGEQIERPLFAVY
ncbi:MAG: transcriptional regulator [Desulfosalsimonadaceae bacterium]